MFTEILRHLITIKVQVGNVDPPNNLTIFQVADLRDKLLEMIEIENKIVIDLSQLQVCDVAGLQLLVSCIKTANEAKIELLFCNAPDYFRKKITDAGLDANIFPLG